MGNLGLFLLRHLAEGLGLFRNQKHRVVAKAAASDGRKGNRPFTPARRRQGIPAGKRAGHGGFKVGRAGGYAPHGV
ncbi:hypothetical protein SDC9_146647 [bioreactor metagenome]|uniref:Uncharacterized protein n=1 Tax=bioreactor metagenome TaxID=1076179 RepID=A0A645ECN0_9ZZZZ